MFLQVLRVLLRDGEHADVIHEQQQQVRSTRDRNASAQSRFTERVLCPAGGGAADEGRVCGGGGGARRSHVFYGGGGENGPGAAGALAADGNRTEHCVQLTLFTLPLLHLYQHKTCFCVKLLVIYSALGPSHERLITLFSLLISLAYFQSA